MQEVPILTLPLAPVVVGLVLLLLVVAIGASRFAQRRNSKVGGQSAAELAIGRAVEGMRDLAALVSAQGEILACSEAFSEWLSLGVGGTLTGPLKKTAERVAASATAELAGLPLDGEGHLTMVEALPVSALHRAFAVLLLIHSSRREDQRTSDHAKLLGALAHEIRTPLTAIIGHIENLRSMGPQEEELRSRSQALIADQSYRLARLVEDLAKVSRLEAAPLNLRATNARSMAEKAVSAVYSQAEGKQIELLIKAEEALPRVRADPDRIEQALINLLDNAVKYTPPHGTVTLSLLDADGAVEVGVSDTGPGIQPQDRPHVFDPFFRGSRTDLRAIPGSGLGLTIVKLILAQHGSEIRVTDNGGIGTTFSFTLPLWA